MRNPGQLRRWGVSRRGGAVAVLVFGACEIYFTRSPAKVASSPDFLPLPIRSTAVTYQYTLAEVGEAFGINPSRDTSMLRTQIVAKAEGTQHWRSEMLVEGDLVQIRRPGMSLEPLRRNLATEASRIEVRMLAFEGSRQLEAFEPNSGFDELSLDETQADDLESRLRGSDDPAVSEPGETCFTLLNAHSAKSTFLSKEDAYVSGLTRIPSGKGIAYNPQLTLYQSGVEVSCTASFSSVAESVGLTIHSRVHKVRSLALAVHSAVNGVPWTYVEVPDAVTAESSRVLHIGAHRAVIVPLVNSRAVRLSDPRSLYLLVRWRPAS